MTPRPLFASACLAGLLAFSSGCLTQRVMTPAELEQHESHPYAGQSKARVFEATSTALRSMGYEIVVRDAASGRLKTAPKLIMVRAVSDGYNAMASSREIAWTVDVSDASGGTVVHAEPRGFAGGQSVDASHMDASFLESSFDTLYSEIESNLPKAAATAAPPSPLGSKGHAKSGPPAI